jgi:protein-disulfide isomerase
MPRMPPKKKIANTEENLNESEMQQEGTLTFKATHFYAVLVVLALAVGILTGYVAWGRTPAAPVVVTQAAAMPQAAATPTLEQVDYAISVEGSPSLGPEDAPITIVEFSDYQVLQAYPGKIRFVYRNYPLPFHQNAMTSAEAALCAGDQDQYWAYHDKIFTEKAQVNNAAGTTLETDTYVGWARDLGLDAAAFEACLKDEKYKQAIETDITYASNLPTENGEPAVGGTPTFFINGRRLVGAYPFPSFKQIIDEQLAALP